MPTTGSMVRSVPHATPADMLAGSKHEASRSRQKGPMTTPGDPALAQRSSTQNPVAERNPLEHDLEQLLGEDSIVPMAQAHEYLHDSTEMQSLRGRADAIARPANTEQVAELVT